MASNKNQSAVRPDTNDSGFDAYGPEQVAALVEQVGVKKTRYPAYKTIMLGILGGTFISFGAMYELYIMAHPGVSSGVSAVLAPLFYAVGYIIAFISGAEIFTTNNLSAMSLASGKVTLPEVTRNWGLVFIANMVGAMAVVMLFFASGLTTQFDYGMIDAAKSISSNKLNFNAFQTVVIGIVANMLICSGLWLAMAGRSLTDKFLALLVPVAAVPALNFQHGAGNMFQFFLALLSTTETVDLELPTELTFTAISLNLVLVGIGNIIGGGVFIALVYYFVFVRETRFDK